MDFSEILGQRRVIRLLRQAVQRGNLPHAFLFTGMEGVGKSLTALTFAKALNCAGGTEADCCNRCLSCRKVNNGNHPDVFAIEREGPFIKIDQIRTLQQRLRFRPLEGDYRVMVIVDAQNLKVEAANALLKILEEPPPENIFILTASDTTTLLPTIVSRCLHLRFQPIAAEEIASFLQQNHEVSPERAAVTAELAGGSLSRAVALLDDRHRSRRRLLLETVAKIPSSPVADLLAATERWQGENKDLSQDLDWLKTWTRDLLFSQLQEVSSGDLINLDFAEQIAAIAPQFRPDYLVKVFELLCAIQEAMRYNINKRLSLEVFFLFLRAGCVGEQAGSGTMMSALAKGPHFREFYG
jgi:DNA polymerase-3 subunit delta'